MEMSNGKSKIVVYVYYYNNIIIICYCAVGELWQSLDQLLFTTYSTTKYVRRGAEDTVEQLLPPSHFQFTVSTMLFVMIFYTREKLTLYISTPLHLIVDTPSTIVSE